LVLWARHPHRDAYRPRDRDLPITSEGSCALTTDRLGHVNSGHLHLQALALTPTIEGHTFDWHAYRVLARFHAAAVHESHVDIHLLPWNCSLQPWAQPPTPFLAPSPTAQHSHRHERRRPHAHGRPKQPAARVLGPGQLQWQQHALDDSDNNARRARAPPVASCGIPDKLWYDSPARPTELVGRHVEY
jgi:hypothetical protein